MISIERLAIVVEGHGDVIAVPCLVSRAAAHFDRALACCDPPIRAGEAKRLRRPGELERYLIMAASRPEASRVLVLLDLDDGCPVEYFQNFYQRSLQARERCGKPIHFCFCKREFESWFLADFESMQMANPSINWTRTEGFDNYDAIRGAKEAFGGTMAGRVYKECRDQIHFTRALNFDVLISRDRAFRKLAKDVFGVAY